MKNDFLGPAVSESQRLLSEYSVKSPLNSSFSLCLQRTDRTPFRLFSIVMELGTTFGAIGLFLLSLDNFLPWRLSHAWLPGDFKLLPPGIIAIYLLILGDGFIFAAEFFYAGLYKLLFNRRPGGWSELIDNYVKFNVEDSSSKSSLKMITEDNGFCRVDAQNGRLIFDGASYQFIILARDVIGAGAEKVGNSRGIRIRFQVGQAEADVFIRPTGQSLLIFANLLPKTFSRMIFPARRGLDELYSFLEIVNQSLQENARRGYLQMPAYELPRKS